MKEYTNMARTTKRTDAHSPASPDFDPANYTEIAGWYQGSDTDVMRSYSRENSIVTKAVAASGTVNGNWEQKSTCDHCGAAFSYGVAYTYKPTGQVVVVGHICAGNTFDLSSRVEYLRKQAEALVAANGKRRAIQIAAAAFRDQNRDVVAHLEARRNRSAFYSSLLTALETWGTLTPGQLAAANKAMLKDREWEAAQAQRDAARPARAECPTGDGLTIEGKVISLKEEINEFAYAQYTWRMLVETTTGYRVYGTLPRALDCLDSEDRVKVGDSVRFVANVEQSRKDVHFGFFKRPRQASRIA